MAGLTDYSATNVLAYITGKTAMPALPTAYIGLFTTPPSSDSGVVGAVEVSGGSYVRFQTSGSTWNAPSNSSGSEPGVTPANITNASTVTFVSATANWGTVVAFGLFDAATNGNCLAWDYLGNFIWIPASVSLASPGVFTSHAHGYSNNDPVVVTTKFGGTLPTFSQSNFTGTLTVQNVTTDTFTVLNSATAVNTSSSGDLMVRKLLQQTVNTGVQLSFGAGQLIITGA